MLRKLNPTEYQEALLLKLWFQKSDECLKFREVWDIPAGGFTGYQEYNIWYQKLIADTNTYLTSDKYKEWQKKLTVKHKERYQGKITPVDVEIFAYRAHLTVPLHKFEHDVGQATIHSGKPVYWRYFIERCLLFKDFDVFPVTRPLPEPKTHWDNYTQTYDLTIENIFPDTTTKDFDDRRFTRKLKEMQKKLPGYQKSRPRLKRKLEYGLKALELDKQRPGLSDVEKTEELEGEVSSGNWGEIERKRANNLKHTRRRLKGYLGKIGRSKERS
ncbi:hypothetical protein C4544_03465 [candidate division WS5 bacterium]|uniref:Uncharacterized protein n=1 Tax=candidate division WS5 bacterium TaxID=2093353 RepID=A0A419DDP4_9BACT|nr:MAG: hypothetical protein C4544_03465 [candidate division WS5 bacterium]